MAKQPALPEHRPGSASESSTFLRFMAIIASKASEDFEFDDSRAMIKLSHIWIAEAPTQEETHDRYTNSTFFILSCIAPQIDRKRDSEDKADVSMVEEYDDLEAKLSACHIVLVSTDKKDYGHIDEIKMVTRTGRQGDEDEIMPIKGSEISAPIHSFDTAMREARENGFRRINCSARMLYFRAMKLAYRCGYLDPDEGVDVRGGAARADDLRDEEEKIRRRP